MDLFVNALVKCLLGQFDTFCLCCFKDSLHDISTPSTECLSYKLGGQSTYRYSRSSIEFAPTQQVTHSCTSCRMECVVNRARHSTAMVFIPKLVSGRTS